MRRALRLLSTIAVPLGQKKCVDTTNGCCARRCYEACGAEGFCFVYGSNGFCAYADTFYRFSGTSAPSERADDAERYCLSSNFPPCPRVRHRSGYKAV